MKRLLLLALVFCSAFALSAQSAFQFTGEDKASLNLTQLVKDLKSAPLEFTQAKSNTFVSLPLPSGDFAEYSVFSSPIVKNNEVTFSPAPGAADGLRLLRTAYPVSLTAQKVTS
jgi:hypothetical protein